MSVAFSREPFDNVANVSTEPGRPVEMARDMTLRDHYVGLAMLGYIARSPGEDFDMTAVRFIHGIADLMMKARS